MKLKLIIIKICALRYINIVSTTKNTYMYEKFDTNRNWYSLKCKHTYIKIYMSIQKCQYWYQLKESNDTNWNNNKIKCISHIPILPFMFKCKMIFTIKHTWAWSPIQPPLKGRGFQKLVWKWSMFENLYHSEEYELVKWKSF